MNTGTFHAILLVSAVGLPLAFAVAFACARWRTTLGKLAPWTALPALLAALWPAHDTMVTLQPLLLGARLGLDELGRSFLLFTALLWLLSAWFAQGYLAEDQRRARFFFFYLLAMTGNFALVLAQDMLSFYAGFALMSFSSYGLIVYRGNAEAFRAGRIYLCLVVLGELLLFVALVILARGSGSVEFHSMAGMPVSRLAIIFVLLGFGIKAGMLPLHVWLPLAHPVAPTPASAVLSGAMIKAGLLGWLRFLPAGQPVVQEYSSVLVAAGLAATFFGVVVGITQQNPKTVLAYSSISQMGLLTMGVGAILLGPDTAPGAVVAVALCAAHHGLAKGALFLGVGMATAARTAVQRRWLNFGLLLPALALAGAPFTSGAVSKTALKAIVTSLPSPWPEWISVLLPLAALGTTLLMARFLMLTWSHQDSHTGACRPASMWLAWCTLLVAVAAFSWFWPGADRAAHSTILLPKLWGTFWPVAAGGLVAWMIWRKRSSPPHRRWPQIPAGDLWMFVEWAVTRLRRQWPINTMRNLADHATQAVTSLRNAFVLRATRSFNGTTEVQFRSWSSVGLLLVLVFGALLLALTFR